MTEHEPRVLWSDEQLDEALHTLNTGDAGDLSGPRAALQRALAAPQPALRPAAVRRHRRWPYAAVAAGVAVLAAGALVATDPFGGPPARHVQGQRSSGATTVVTAAGALNLAADHTTTVADVTAKPGQFLYVDNKVVSVSQ